MTQQDIISIGTFKTITTAITNSNDLPEMVEYLCNLLTDALDLKGCAIFLLNDDQTELQLLASTGLSAEYILKGPVHPKKSLGSTIQGEAIVISDPGHDKRMQYPQQARNEGIETILEIPIGCLGRIIGSFRLYQSVKWEISEQDLDSLYVLGELIGMALSYMELDNSLQAIQNITENVKFIKGQF
ncbi:MAG: GAF domain-containing protein [Desulfohalobiaceae bacterium]|nr:GAF domain-containing protein [Desulfohalobiaceae bacterium]